MTLKSELLVAMAAAGGVDLQQAAKLAATEPPARDTVPGNYGARILTPPKRNRVAGRETRGMLRPQWTIQEVGQAAQGLPECEFRAALFAFAGAHEHMVYLRRELLGQGRMFSRIYHWPTVITDFHGIEIPYLEHLCQLVLDHDAHPAQFNTFPGLFAIFMRVSDRVWERQLYNRFRDLQGTWQDWLGHAARSIQARLSESEDQERE